MKYYIGTVRKDLFKIDDGVEDWIMQMDKPGELAIIENNGKYNHIVFRQITEIQFKTILKKASVKEVVDLLHTLINA
jgi:hypothetical protein